MNRLEAIRKRRSVRAFDGRKVTEEELKKILEFAEKVENPYDIPITFKLLDLKKDRLSVPVISGTDTYIAGKMKKLPQAEEAFGYTFEMIVLFAESLGIGTTWIAGTMDRGAFERAMELKEDEVMPCVSPLGYPAKKMSLKETIMRKGVKADTRLGFNELFYQNDFDHPLSEEQVTDDVREILEMIRLAPSAVNKQPWRVILKDNRVHFYEYKSKGFKNDSNWDIQKIDMGIALCHFAVAAREKGLSPAFVLDDAPQVKDQHLRYIASYVI